MQAHHRLRENRDFRRVFQRGKSAATSKLVLYWFKNWETTYRVGFSVSKKVGNAVVRNRMKRRLREVFMAHETLLDPLQLDFVVVCRKGSGDLSYHEIDIEVEKLFRRAKFMV